MELEASFSALESAVEHIGWMLRQDPMQRVTLDILPPVEVQAPCAVCDARLMVPLETARRILAGTDWVEHDRKNHRVLSLAPARSEEHTSELQSLMRISYAVFCLKKKTTPKTKRQPTN